MIYGIILFLAGFIATLIKINRDRARENHDLKEKLKDAGDKVDKVLALSKKYREMAARTERGEYNFIELPDDPSSNAQAPNGVPGDSK